MVTLPASGASTVDSTLMVVVLPAPLGHSSSKYLLLSDGEGVVVDYWCAIEALTEAHGGEKAVVLGFKGAYVNPLQFAYRGLGLPARHYRKRPCPTGRTPVGIRCNGRGLSNSQ